MSQLKWAPIATIASQVEGGKRTARDNVQQAMDEIQRHRAHKAIISTTKDRAFERAQKIDDQISRGERVGRLAGVPFIAKDNFLTFGSDTTAASNMLRGFKAPYQATVIDKLEAEGAICVAKANLDAFAHGSSTENSDYFTTLNPHDKTRVPGGSSGGSAAAVMLDMAPFALGTDTGGSIRQPASFCGAVGYKPTYGLVSRSGVIAMASSTDVIGPITKTVQDAALILDVMSGRDQLDGTTIERDSQPYTNLETIPKQRIGLVKEYFSEDVSLAVRRKIETAVNKLARLGHTITTVSLPSLPLALACYYVICPAEVSSNLSRYDGLRFGYRDAKATNLNEHYELSRTTGFGKEAKRRIMIGTYVLSSGYYEAYYKQAQTVRTKLINEFNDMFNKVDFLAGPTTPETAFKLGEHSANPLSMYLTDIMTVAANLVGVPAVSIPAGYIDKLPVGLQLMAQQKRDRQLLSLAQQAEGVLV